MQESLPYPIMGELVWRPMGSVRRQAESILEAKLGASDTAKEAEREETHFEVRFGLDYIQKLADQTVDVPHDLATGETSEDVSRRRRRVVQLERVQRFTPAVFWHVLDQIDRHTFDFARQSYAFLRYGNVLTDIWHDYRRQVDATLQGMGFTPYLEQIQTGLQSESPKGWRTAVYECRTVLEDLGNRLWLDPRKTYAATGDIYSSPDRGPG